MSNDDKSVLERVRAGETAAFEILVERYQARIIRLAARVLGDPSQAEDAAQEVFVRFYQSLHRFEQRSQLFTYLYRITVNYCLRQRMRRQEFLDAQQWRVIAAAADGPEESVTRDETAQVVRSALSSLLPYQRAVLRMQRFEQMSLDEMSTQLGVSVQAVKSRLFRARLALKRQLAQYQAS